MKEQIAENLADAATQAAIAGAGSKATWAGAVVAIGGWLSSTEGAAITGLLIAAIGIVIQVVFRLAERRVLLRRDAREEELHRLRVARLSRGLDPDDTATADKP